MFEFFICFWFGIFRLAGQLSLASNNVQTSTKKRRISTMNIELGLQKPNLAANFHSMIEVSAVNEY